MCQHETFNSSSGRKQPTMAMNKVRLHQRACSARETQTNPTSLKPVVTPFECETHIADVSVHYYLRCFRYMFALSSRVHRQRFSRSLDVVHDAQVDVAMKSTAKRDNGRTVILLSPFSALYADLSNSTAAEPSHVPLTANRTLLYAHMFRRVNQSVNFLKCRD